MIKKLLCPGLLETGHVSEKLMVVRDGMVNSYILKTGAGLLCIDTGWRPVCVSRAFEILGLKTRDVASVLLTHMHWDHARCLTLFPDAEVFVGKYEIPSVFVNVESNQPLKRVKGGQTLTAGGFTVNVIDTPGHTSGSLSYVVDKNLLFTGDTLRLKHGKVLPFPFWLNKDGNVLNQSIQRLTGINEIKCLLTSHSGISWDIDKAFSLWRESAVDLAHGGDS
jgi:glyoxylase-like metal-dependent hydrolase (beta-lactamase superfamily II)